MNTEANDKLSNVKLVPGYWLASGRDGTPVACCGKLSDIDDAVRKAGANPDHISLQKLPLQSDGLFLGGIEIAVDTQDLMEQQET